MGVLACPSPARAVQGEARIPQAYMTTGVRDCPQRSCPRGLGMQVPIAFLTWAFSYIFLSSLPTGVTWKTSSTLIPMSWTHHRKLWLEMPEGGGILKALQIVIERSMSYLMYQKLKISVCVFMYVYVCVHE